MKKNILYYFLAFLIPFIIFNGIFLVLDISFISNKNVLTSDMQAQYLSLFAYLKNVASGTESLFYSFSNGLGGSMLSTIAYYLASPLNLLLLLVNETNLYKVLSLFITLKIGLSGLTMYIYLDKKINSKKIYTLLFSTCYAMMAYNVNYYFNVMWLDGVILAPIILLGIDKILEGKKSLLFGISLFIAILSNYYIGYMICLFTVIYTIYSLFIKFDYKKDSKIMIKCFLRYMLTGILSTLMASFIIVPGIIGLTNSNKEVGGIFDNAFKIALTPLDVISRTYLGTHNASLIINQDTINIYIGLICIPLLFMYFFNRNISKKEKIAFLIVIVLFLLGTAFIIGNKIWHGFSLPQGFNYRYSFLFSLFFIMISYKSFTKLNHVNLKTFILFYIVYVILSILVIFIVKIDYPNYYIFISLGVMLLYLLLLYNLRKDIKDIKILLILMVLAEFFFNTYIAYKDYTFSENEVFDEYFIEINNYINKYKSSDKFYRMEKNYSLTSNDELLLNYKGVEHFLSTANGGVIDFLKKMGLKGHNLNIDYSLNSTEILDSIIGVKYVFSTDKISYYNEIEEIKTEGVRLSNNVDIKYVYQNMNSLSLGYMVSEKVKDYKDVDNLNGYEYQNLIMNYMLDNNSNYFIEKEVQKKDNYYIIKDKCETCEEIYLYLKFDSLNKNEQIVFYLDNDMYKFFSTDSNLIRVPKVIQDRKISFKVLKNNEEKEYDGDLEIKLYNFDTNLFDEEIASLKDEQLNVSLNKNKITGTINVLEDGILFLSIPYEKGFQIYVDGKLTDYDIIFDTFIGTYLEKGEHKIEITYKTPFLKISIIISLISLVIFVIYEKKQKTLTI